MLAPDFTLTAAADKFMRRMVRFSDHPTGGFRLSVKPGGCSGYSSEFSIQAAPAQGEAEFNLNGLRLFLPVESRLLLNGVTIDFTESAVQSGLSFINPAAESCACSSAGAADKPAQASVSVASIKRVQPVAPA
jgi:iron-sulfur cluster assembly protein